MEEADYERDTSLEKKRKEIKRGSLTLFSGRWCRAEGGGLDHDACYAEPMQRHSRLVFSIRKESHRVCGATRSHGSFFPPPRGRGELFPRSRPSFLRISLRFFRAVRRMLAATASGCVPAFWSAKWECRDGSASAVHTLTLDDRLRC
jgi:hypothetical protein